MIMRLLLLVVCTFASIWPAWAADPALVGFETREYLDAGRSNWQNSGVRPLSTVIWYPASARYPVVLLSHGSTSVNLSLGWLGAYLAEHGYIAAAVNHHGNTGAEGQLLSQERAADLSAVLDQMLADPKFGSHIDARRVFAAGHSAGGATVIMLAGGKFSGDEIAKFCDSAVADASCEPRELIAKAITEFARLRPSDPAVQASVARSSRSYRDPRIRAVAAMAPAVGPAFTEATLHGIAVPVFIITAKADAITPPVTNALRYARLIPDARLLTVRSTSSSRGACWSSSIGSSTGVKRRVIASSRDGGA